METVASTHAVFSITLTGREAGDTVAVVPILMSTGCSDERLRFFVVYSRLSSPLSLSIALLAGYVVDSQLPTLEISHRFGLGEEARVPGVIFDSSLDFLPLVVGNAVKCPGCNHAGPDVFRGNDVDGQTYTIRLPGKLLLLTSFASAKKHEIKALFAIVAERNWDAIRVLSISQRALLRPAREGRCRSLRRSCRCLGYLRIALSSPFFTST